MEPDLLTNSAAPLPPAPRLTCSAGIATSGVGTWTHSPSRSSGGRLSKILFNSHPEENSICIGLHTCGPLANSIIKASTINKQNQLLNFGCCYSKLEPGEKVGISQASKKYPLPLSKYALTLATRAHTGLNWDEYLLKKKVKEYRYGIHLFIYHVIGIKNFLHVGDGTKSDYKNSFSCYVSSKKYVR